jgi:hypothetical protein
MDKIGNSRMSLPVQPIFWSILTRLVSALRILSALRPLRCESPIGLMGYKLPQCTWGKERNLSKSQTFRGQSRSLGILCPLGCTRLTKGYPASRTGWVLVSGTQNILSLLIPASAYSTSFVGATLTECSINGFELQIPAGELSKHLVIILSGGTFQRNQPQTLLSSILGRMTIIQQTT